MVCFAAGYYQLATFIVLCAYCQYLDSPDFTALSSLHGCILLRSMKASYQKLRPILLTCLSLGVGYLTISTTTVLLYAVWLGGEGHAITSQFLAFAAVSGLGFSALSGYLAALVAQRTPIAHAAGFALMLTVIWGFSTFLLGSNEPLFISLLNIAIALTGIMTGGLMRRLQMNAQGKADPSTETVAVSSD